MDKKNQSKPTTTAPVQLGEFSGAEREFGRDRHVEEIFGIKRGTLRNLWSDGKVKSVLLRVRGAKSGVRLWHMNSIRDFIEAEAARSNLGAN